jgi:hypothetical protein
VPAFCAAECLKKPYVAIVSLRICISKSITRLSARDYKEQIRKSMFEVIQKVIMLQFSTRIAEH